REKEAEGSAGWSHRRTANAGGVNTRFWPPCGASCTPHGGRESADRPTTPCGGRHRALRPTANVGWSTQRVGHLATHRAHRTAAGKAPTALRHPCGQHRALAHRGKRRVVNATRWPPSGVHTASAAGKAPTAL